MIRLSKRYLVLPIALLGFALLVTLAACDDSGVEPDEEEPGTYELTIDGDEYEGNAFFFSGTVEGESGCALYLTDAESAEQIGTGEAAVVGFAVQENTCEDATSSVGAFDPEGEDPDISNQFALVFYDLRTEMPSIYFSQGGSLDVDVSGDRLAGVLDDVEMATFEFPEEPGGEPELVSVSFDGVFNAERTDFTDFDIDPPTQ